MRGAGGLAVVLAGAFAGCTAASTPAVASHGTAGTGRSHHRCALTQRHERGAHSRRRRRCHRPGKPIRPRTPLVLPASWRATGAPIVTTGATRSVERSSATVTGTVNPLGLPTAYHFEYGTTDAYGSATSARPAREGFAAGTVAETLAGLEPATVYHYRVVADNSSGTRHGPDMTFATAGARYLDSVANTAGLAAWWRLDETSGTSARDARGNHSGTYTGPIGLGAPGALGDAGNTAARFDGAAYVDVPDSADLTPRGAFTLEAWFAAEPHSGERYIVSKTEWPNGYALYLDGHDRLRAAALGAGYALQAASADPVSTGDWHHAAAVFDGGALTLYLDGVLVGRAEGRRSFAVSTGSGPFRIGAYPSATSFWHGSLDEVAYYTTALPAATVRDHYLAGDDRPAVQTGAPAAVGPTDATLTANVDASGPATSHFEYGATTAYSGASAEQAGGGDVRAALSGLTPGATYHYRVVAHGAGGTRYGADRSFVAGGYRNPVALDDFPDPSVIADGGQYYAYGTGFGFPILRSSDLVNWARAGTAFTPGSAPAWSSGDDWAPSVLPVETTATRPCPGFTLPAGARCFYMYYVGLNAGGHCVGVATSDRPDGGFVDQGILRADGASGQPIGCGDANGRGNIDPQAFVDSDGHAYLYVSTDLACSGGCSLRPTISVIPLAPDLVHAAGGRTALFGGDAGTWEQAGAGAPTVEGPFVVKRGTRYFLFYSGGSWQADYGMGVAVGASPLGPFTKSTGNPILRSGPGASGAGGGSLVAGPRTGGDELVYHAREGSGDDSRTLRIDRVVWNDAAGTVSIDGPTNGERPLP